jgi:hypothetical protein
VRDEPPLTWRETLEAIRELGRFEPKEIAGVDGQPLAVTVVAAALTGRGDR